MIFRPPALLYDDPHETSSDRDGSADMRITEDDTSVVTPTQPGMYKGSVTCRSA